MIDTPMEKRRYYRHTKTGDRAYLILVGGKEHIRLDRPNEEIVRPFNDSEWIEERSEAPLSPAQVAQVAFEADKKLCAFLGLHLTARKEWASLLDRERIAWMQDGPDDAMRQRLWGAIMGAMDVFTRRE
jgi:hypothetical protein